MHKKAKKKIERAAKTQRPTGIDGGQNGEAEETTTSFCGEEKSDRASVTFFSLNTAALESIVCWIGWTLWDLCLESPRSIKDKKLDGREPLELTARLLLTPKIELLQFKLHVG